MRKQTVIFIQAMMVMAIVSGCRSNPTAMATNENGVMQEEQEIITDAGSDNALEEVPERLVWSYESLNGIKNLDIPIERTNQKLLCEKYNAKKNLRKLFAMYWSQRVCGVRIKNLHRKRKQMMCIRPKLRQGWDRIYQDSYLYLMKEHIFTLNTIGMKRCFLWIQI